MRLGLVRRLTAGLRLVRRRSGGTAGELAGPVRRLSIARLRRMPVRRRRVPAGAGAGRGLGEGMPGAAAAPLTGPRPVLTARNSAGVITGGLSDGARRPNPA